MDLPVGDQVSTAILRCGSYEAATLRLVMELARSAQTVVDIGAQFGQFTVAAAAVLPPGGRVLSFEPNPNWYLELVSNVKLSGRTNVIPVLAAASRANGLLALDFRTSAVSAIAIGADDNRTAEIVVSAVCVADLLRGLGMACADVVKIDVEGHEGDVIEGLFAPDLSPPKHIIFEYLPDQFPQGREVVERLTRMGYTLREVTGRPFDLTVPPLESNVWACLVGVGQAPA